MTPYLAFDVSRCQGTQAAQCSDCLRRIAPGSPLRQVWIAPPEGAKTGACESRIASEKLTPQEQNTLESHESGAN